MRNPMPPSGGMSRVGKGLERHLEVTLFFAGYLVGLVSTLLVVLLT